MGYYVGTVARHYNRQIAFWLLCVCALVFLMVMVGGITRLMEAGLSMVRWEPLSGILPPLSEAEWQQEFAHYKEYPEYQKINKGMSLTEFKGIFYWEYGHRLLGRVIGLAFFLPLLYFLIKRRVSAALMPKLIFMFILGGAQGFLGWFMVKSGLVDHPDVSHYRLTAHLGLAVFIYGYMFWVACDLLTDRYSSTLGGRNPIRITWLFIVLVYTQILLGGLVAGLNAGFSYNTWPLMDGALIPEGLFDLSPWYYNLTSNLITVQFNHRLLAYVIVFMAIGLWFKFANGSNPRLKVLSLLLLIVVGLQVALGILTLVYVVPVALASLHQMGAMVVFSVGLLMLHRMKV
ncbi:MAG: heme A synthase [Kordiimonas sp.]|nr:heme A synthase [Kordiimonas sp.]